MEIISCLKFRFICTDIQCLHMNARSLVNKTEEFQIFAVETWLKPCVLNCELLPGLDFTIHRRDRSSQVGGGILLAVNNMIKSFQCKDLEGNAEIIACELRPNSQRKILVIVFYWPLDTNSNYLKQSKKPTQCVRCPFWPAFTLWQSLEMRYTMI